MGSTEDIPPLSSPGDYLKVPEAAKFLNRNPETVKRYIRMGVLRGKRFRGSGKSWWIHKHDLEAFKHLEQDIRLNSRDMWELLKGIRIRLHAIDNKLDFLMHINGLDVSTLRDADTDTLVSLYDEASDFLDLELDLVPVDQVEQWSIVLMQVTELELERLVAPCQDYEPWKPFHELCRRLLLSLRRRKGFKSNGRMQEVYRMLDKARKSIGQATVVFTEKYASELGPKKRSSVFMVEARMDSLDRYIAEELDNPDV